MYKQINISSVQTVICVAEIRCLGVGGQHAGYIAQRVMVQVHKVLPKKKIS